MQKIPLTKELEAFNIHLQHNNRVVLSAKFGDGKSTFLDTFKQTYSKDYKFVEIHPLGYAIAPNNNIFEYLKRDILLQLVGEKEALDFNVDLETLIKETFNWNSLLEVLGYLSCMLPAGPVLNRIMKKCSDIKQRYDAKKSTLPRYLDDFALQKGGIYERDVYTILIEETIKRINQRECGTNKTVLIIEDLDRIDPAHIFRILNILGANINDATSENKFFFSNIIFVMDYEVTEHIFHHFYGEKANYSGYMSKFVSNYPFRFSISNVAKEYMKDFLDQQCGLNCKAQKFLIYEKHSTNVHSLFSVIENLSIRQIANITDNIEAQITDHPVKLESFGEISPVAPLTKLIAVLVRIGERFDLSVLFDELVKQKELPYLLQQCLLLDPFFQGNVTFVFEDSYFSFNESSTEDGRRTGFVSEGKGYALDVDRRKLKDIFYKASLLVRDINKVAL